MATCDIHLPNEPFENTFPRFSLLASETEEVIEGIKLSIFSADASCSLHREEEYLHQNRTFEEMAVVPADVSGGCLNAKPLHSSLDFVPPDEFELKYVIC